MLYWEESGRREASTYGIIKYLQLLPLQDGGQEECLEPGRACSILLGQSGP